MSATFRNPVVPGFHPDPSVVRVGEDFYLVTSTFEFFPAVPVMHSRDLVHWHTIGHCIDRPEQMTFAPGNQGFTGIYAPTIRYHDGVFYMITTKVGGEGGGNFYVTATDPAGPWSMPVRIPTPGIDPDLFFDEDGRVWQSGTHESVIYTQEIDLEKGEMIGQRQEIWRGTGAASSEGPHIYRANGWYYLLISEGGTERGHMLSMARSRCVTGPYEPCPHNPVLTNRSTGLPLQAVGHADLFQDQHGAWWAVCLGIREFGYPQKHELGRETMLMPVDFSGEWPVFGENGRLMEEFTVPALPGETAPDGSVDDYAADFSAPQLDFTWNYLYAPGLARLEKGELVLTGNALSLSDPQKIAWVGRRQVHHDFEACVTLTFPAMQEGEEAGIDAHCAHRHHYEAALTCLEGRRQLIFRRQIGSLWKIENRIDFPEDTVRLRLTGGTDHYVFSFLKDGEWTELGRGETAYLSTEVGGAFTGNYIGLYCAGNGAPCQGEARFRDFTCRRR